MDITPAVLISALTSIFLAIIGCYALIIRHIKSTNIQLGKIYETINAHVQDDSCHPDESDLVRSDVCAAVKKAIIGEINNLKDGVKRIDATSTKILEHLIKKG